MIEDEGAVREGGSTAEFTVQPCAGHAPISFGGGERDIERCGGLCGGESAEEPEFDEAGLPCMERCEGLEGLVQGEDIDGAGRGAG